MADRAEIAALYDNGEPGFIDFMCRVDEVVRRANDAGFGVADFADACWMDLFEDAGPECSDEAICETLADADDIFARMQEL